MVVGTGICKDTINVQVEVMENLNVDYDITQADCNNLGFINLNPTSGSGTYTYDWADLPGASDPEDRSGLVPGSYNVTITDSNGCSETLNDLLVGDFCDCDANAGNITADNNPVCFESGSATLTASLEGDQVVPAGFAVAYVLTTGSDLTILNTNTNPFFTVTELGTYTIHTLVYDPITLSLSFIEFGTTPAEDLLELISQGGGDICAMLDVAGAEIEVTEAVAAVTSISEANCDLCNGQVSLSPSTYVYNLSLIHI